MTTVVLTLVLVTGLCDRLEYLRKVALRKRVCLGKRIHNLEGAKWTDMKRRGYYPKTGLGEDPGNLKLDMWVELIEQRVSRRTEVVGM